MIIISAAETSGKERGGFKLQRNTMLNQSASNNKLAATRKSGMTLYD